MTLRAPHFSPKRPVVATVFLAVAAFQSGSPLALIEDAGEKPFFQNDWPNPQIQEARQPQIRGNILPLIVAAPFFQTDWPNPQFEGVQQPVQTRRSPDFMEAGEKPFLQTEWPNPTVAVKVQTPVQVGSSLNLIEDAGERPFFQTEWPNPLPVKIQQPFQHQKSAALEITALPPGAFIFQNPVFPIAQQPLQLQKALVLFEPCDVGSITFVSPAPVDTSTTISENVDNTSTISENIDQRGLIFTGSTDTSTTISETIDTITTICET